MTRNRIWTVLLALASALIAAAALAGQVNMLVVADEGETIDLSVLNDGETRIFGSGDKQLTAVRDGGVVTISRDAAGADKPLSIQCRLATDVCLVTTDEDQERVMVKVERKRECVSGVGDCEELDVHVVAPHSGVHSEHQVWVEALGDCAGSDCENRTIEVVVSEDNPGEKEIVIIGEDGERHVLVGPGAKRRAFFGEGHGAPHVVHVGDDGHVTLRCPEGDSTLRVTREEAEETFLCPKHSKVMEKTEIETHRKVLIKKIHTEDRP